MDNRYKATVVDLPHGYDGPDPDQVSTAYAATVDEAESLALAGSAVNCNRRVYVEDMADWRVVKGPYVCRAKRNGDN